MAIVGPDGKKPCGISDYHFDLAESFKDLFHVSILDYDFICGSHHVNWAQFDAVLLHHEASLWRAHTGLRTLKAQCHAPTFLIPHEVYEENPFVFPYAKLKNQFWFDLKIRQYLYKKRHPTFFEELNLHRKGYHVHSVIPLSVSTSDILEKRGTPNLLAPVPLAFWKRPVVNHTKSECAQMLGIPKPFMKKSEPILGIFGFLSHNSDYRSVINAIQQMGNPCRLLISGGERVQTSLRSQIKQWVEDAGLNENVYLTDYIPDAALGNYLELCDGFVSPFISKSNSSSLLRLIDWGKSIFVPELALTAELRTLGAPVVLYQNESELCQVLTNWSKGGDPLSNRYKYDFQKVAAMYAARMGFGNIID